MTDIGVPRTGIATGHDTAVDEAAPAITGRSPPSGRAGSGPIRRASLNIARATATRAALAVGLPSRSAIAS